jgi:hypothetical protein
LTGNRVDERSQPPPQPVAHHGRTNRTADRERDARRHRVGVVEVRAPQGLASGSATFPSKPIEGSSVADAPDQADSRVRPFNRRDLMIARPARVRIRARNPCLRARRRVLGWKVRFTSDSLSQFGLQPVTGGGGPPRPTGQGYCRAGARGNVCAVGVHGKCTTVRGPGRARSQSW